MSRAFFKRALFESIYINIIFFLDLSYGRRTAAYCGRVYGGI